MGAHQLASLGKPWLLQHMLDQGHPSASLPGRRHARHGRPRAAARPRAPPCAGLDAASRGARGSRAGALRPAGRRLQRRCGRRVRPAGAAAVPRLVAAPDPHPAAASTSSAAFTTIKAGSTSRPASSRICTWFATSASTSGTGRCLGDSTRIRRRGSCTSAASTPSCPSGSSCYDAQLQVDALKALQGDYARRLLSAGHDELRRERYGFASYDDDTPIPDAARRAHLALGPAAAEYGDPFRSGPSNVSRVVRGAIKSRCKQRLLLAGATGLEPATSGVTGRRSNRLSYAPSRRA